MRRIFKYELVPTQDLGAEVLWPRLHLQHVGTVLMRGGSLVLHVFSDGQARS